MTPSEVLHRARALIAGGWHEPLSLDAQGAICGRTDEGITKFCLLDALLTACAEDLDAFFAAEAAVVTQVRHRDPSHRDAPLYRWLEATSRTQADVLFVLAQAAKASRAKEAA